LPPTSSLSSPACGAAAGAAGIDEGCRYLQANLALFTPWRGTEFSTEGLQALAELAIVSDLLADPPVRDDARRHAARWRDHVAEQLTDPALRELPRKRPLQAFPYLQPYLVLRRNGFRDDYWESTLARLADRCLPAAAEAVPYRRLDVHYFLTAAGLGCDGPSETELFDRTFLAQYTDPLAIDDDAAYALTHAVFYLTDFGRRRSPLLPSLEAARHAEVMDSLAVHYWRLGHWDLLGETAACSFLLAGPSATRLAASARLAAARRPDGAVPGTARREEELEQDLPTSEEVFSACYHTTIVALLLDLARLRTQAG
jgi:hypothetical protein